MQTWIILKIEYTKSGLELHLAVLQIAPPLVGLFEEFHAFFVKLCFFVAGLAARLCSFFHEMAEMLLIKLLVNL